MSATVADLHIHTSVTDGRASAEVVIERAARAGLTYLVITDHSAVTWAGLPEVARRHGLTVPFPGVEVSTYLGPRRYHLVGYGPGLLDSGYQARLAPPLEWKYRLAGRVRARLVAAGHRLPDVDTIRAYSDGPGRPTPEKVMLSRSAMARHLAAGAGVPFDDAYALVAAHYREVDEQDRDDPGRLAARYLPALDVLAESRRRGIVVALAHPLWRCRDDRDVAAVCADLGMLREYGLDAVETRSYHHRPYDDHPALLAAADRLGLLPSGGSDYHANGKTELGAGGLDAEAYRRVAELVTRRSAVTAHD